MTKAAPLIRYATLHDIPDLVEIYTNSVNQRGDQGLPPLTEQKIRQKRERITKDFLDNNPTTLYIPESGFLTYSMNKNTAQIHFFHTVPSDKHYGSQLMQQFTEEAKQKGAVFACVFSTGFGKPFYQHWGFSPNPPKSAIMVKKLSA
jgi:hypothetical protein